jgi:hypothetical protein
MTKFFIFKHDFTESLPYFVYINFKFFELYPSFVIEEILPLTVIKHSSFIILNFE